MLRPLSHEPVPSRSRNRPALPALHEEVLVAPGTTALGWLARADASLVTHGLRTAALAAAVARHLGWSEVAAQALQRAALFHDIGKTLLPAGLLAKPGPLSAGELEKIREHPAAGAELLARLEKVPTLAREVALYHHERWDGTGYPTGRAGFDIPEAARIVAVADAYDALTADRTYRDPIPPRAALERLAPDAGAQFDPAAFEVLEALVETELSVVA